MIDPRVVAPRSESSWLVSLLVALTLPGCATPPSITRSSTDLAAAQARAKPGRLVVVRFTLPSRPEPDPMERAIDASVEVRAQLAGHEFVRLDAISHGSLFRDIFDVAPRMAACVMDGRGLVVSARIGYVPPLEFAGLIRRADDAYPLVAALAVEIAAMPRSAKRPARRGKTALLAEAYLLSGNPYAAYKQFTLVTLLAPRVAPARPDVIRACERLARIEIDRGNPREAREWLGQLHEENPDGTAHRSEVQLTEAMIAMAERRVQDAHAILSTLRTDESNKEADRVWFEYGRVCQEAGHATDAARAFTTVVNRFPGSPWRPAAAAELSLSPAAPTAAVDRTR